MNIIPREGGLRGILGGRAIAIAVVAAVSAGCFALGFFVGGAISRSQLEGAGAAAPQEDASFQIPQSPETVVEDAPEAISPADTDEPLVEPGPREGLKTYSVQVGAYLNGKTAEALTARLRNKGYEAYIIKTATPDNRTIYKVRVGRFADRTDAELMARRLEKVAAGESIVTSN
jgi:cell division septation protein DedD